VKTDPSSVDVSVLVPVLDEEAHLLDAAEAMLTQEFEGSIEFLFIDGGSRDSSPDILARLAQRDPRVRVLENPYRRTPHALNIGLRSACGEFVVRMDAHTVYPPCYIAAGVARLRAGNVEWVSGPQIAVGASDGSRRVALALGTALGTGGAGFRREMPGEVEVDSGFTGAWRRATLDAHGGWNEEFVNDQDFELAARIRQSGGRIVCIPEMTASYIPRESLQALARQYVTYGTYRVKTARLHPASLRRSQLLPPSLVLALVAAAISPRPLRRMGAVAIAAYASALTATMLSAARAASPSDAAAVPAVLATMHLSYGVGFLIGSARFGPPIAAIGGILGLDHVAKSSSASGART
jgi:succinoglycan biosynthesis protein ExoA